MKFSVIHDSFCPMGSEEGESPVQYVDIVYKKEGTLSEGTHNVEVDEGAYIKFFVDCVVYTVMHDSSDLRSNKVDYELARKRAEELSFYERYRY